MTEFIAHKVYTEHLSKLRKGVPLFYPEPDSRTSEVQVGDVGIFVDGMFKKLYNAVNGRVDDRSVPDDVENAPRLNYDDRLETTNERFLDAGVYSNMDVKSLSAGVAGGAAPVAVAGAGAGWSFETNKASGGVLMLPSPAKARIVHECLTFVDYIRKHHSTWYHFAKSIGFDCKPEDVIISRGYVKTPRWTVAALQHENHSHKVFLQGQFAAIATAGIHFSLAHDQPCRQESRTGPPLKDEELLSAEIPSVADQCVFLPIYKVKYRLSFWRKIAAAAGYDDLPPGEDDGYARDDTQVVADPEANYDYSPLDILLTYILESTPEAGMAIACEENIDNIINDNVPWPDDFAEYLAEKRPEITYNPETQVATVSLEKAIQEKRSQTIARAQSIQVRPDDAMDVEDDGGSARALLLNPLGSGDIFLSGRRSGSDQRVKWPHISMLDPSAGDATVASMALSPDGTTIATGMDDSVVRVWNYVTGALLKKLNSHEDEVYCVSFSPDGKRLASGSNDTTVIVWNLENEQNPLLHRLDGHGEGVLAVAFSPDGQFLASGSTDSSVRIWNVQSGEETYRFSTDDPTTQQILWTPDGSRIVWGGGMGAKSWVVQGGAPEPVSFTGHTGNVWCMDLSSDTKLLVTGSEDGTARIWDFETGDQHHVLQTESAVWSAVFSSDSTEVVTGNFGGEVSVFNALDGMIKHTWTSLHVGVGEDGGDDDEESDATYTVAFSRRGDLVAAGTANGRVNLYSNQTGSFIAQYIAHTDKMKSVYFSHDDLDIISSSDDGSARVFNISDTLRLVT